jgi:hypothetical protein
MSYLASNAQSSCDEFRPAQSVALIALLSFIGGLVLSHAWQDPAFGLSGPFIFFAVLTLHLLLPKLSMFLGSPNACLSFRKLPKHVQSHLPRKPICFTAPPLIDCVVRKLFIRCYKICCPIYAPRSFTSTKRLVLTFENCFKRLLEIFSAQVLRRPPPRQQA